MIPTSLLSTAAFGLAAQAFLVVPETNSLPETEDNAPTPFFHTTTQSIDLDCSTCPYALNSQRNGAHEWTGDVASELELDFASEENTLKLNDVVFYPLQNPLLPPRLSVSQKKKEDEVSTMEGFEGKLGLSYSMEYNEKHFKDHSLVTVVMTVLGLEDQMIKVDNVEIKAIKEADGQLKLHSVTPIPASPDAPDAKCQTILCRVFAKLINGMNTAKASAKSAAHKVKCVCMKCFHKLTGHKHDAHPGHKVALPIPHRLPDGTIELPTHIQFKPMGHHGHAHHHHHSSFAARMAVILRTTVKVVIVPVLIGVAFGMTASAIGMLVGQFVVFLWTKLRRTRETGAYERVETDEKEAPPAYQDVQGQGAEALNEKEVDAKA